MDRNVNHAEIAVKAQNRENGTRLPAYNRKEMIYQEVRRVKKIRMLKALVLGYIEA